MQRTEQIRPPSSACSVSDHPSVRRMFDLDLHTLVRPFSRIVLSFTPFSHNPLQTVLACRLKKCFTILHRLTDSESSPLFQAVLQPLASPGEWLIDYRPSVQIEAVKQVAVNGCRPGKPFDGGASRLLQPVNHLLKIGSDRKSTRLNSSHVPTS